MKHKVVKSVFKLILFKLILIVYVFLYSNLTFLSLYGDDSISKLTQSLAETLHITQQKYYFDIPFEQSVVKMLDAFVNFDDHSRFLGPEDYNDLLKITNGQFYGIGVILAPKKIDDDNLLVLDIVPEGPAHKNDIKKYDKVIAINNRTIEGLSGEQVVRLLKGPERYSSVVLTLLRNERVLTIAIKRDIVKEEHVRGYYLKDHNIGYCGISLFTHQTTSKLNNILDKLHKRKIKGLILDLRDNSGGVLQAAVDCAGLFLKPNSLVVSTRNRSGAILEQFNTRRRPLLRSVPIIILINSFTASSAEILSGALSYYSKKEQLPYKSNNYIFLLGTSTYGKGSVQEVIPMSNNCALKLTTCLYYLPNNKSIQQIGINPDFIIESKTPLTQDIKLINKLYGKERGTRKEGPTDTKNNTSNKKNHAKRDSWKKEKEQNFKSDYQIQSALNLLCLLDSALLLSNSTIKDHDSAKEFLLNHYITNDEFSLEEIN